MNQYHILGSRSSQHNTPSNSDNEGEATAEDLPQYGMEAAQDVTLSVLSTWASRRMVVYSGDRKVFILRPHFRFGLVDGIDWTLCDAAGEENVLARARRCSSWYSITGAMWEVRQGGKDEPPIANITYKRNNSTWQVEFMGDNEVSECLTVVHKTDQAAFFPIMKRGAEVARFTKRTRDNRRHRYDVWVKQGEPLWVILLLYSLLKNRSDLGRRPDGC